MFQFFPHAFCVAICLLLSGPLPAQAPTYISVELPDIWIMANQILRGDGDTYGNGDWYCKVNAALDAEGNIRLEGELMFAEKANDFTTITRSFKRIIKVPALEKCKECRLSLDETRGYVSGLNVGARGYRWYRGKGLIRRVYFQTDTFGTDAGRVGGRIVFSPLKVLVKCEYAYLVPENFQTDSMKPQAIILTDGRVASPNAKTTHGLLRTSERFRIAGVVAEADAGEDAGELLDGNYRNIPVFENIEAAVEDCPDAKYCIVGVATPGGVFPDAMLDELRIAIEMGLSVVNGLHDYLADRPDFAKLARIHGVELLDIRRPKPRHELHFWTGAIFQLKTPVIAVIGTDCALGKRTTTRFVQKACNDAGLKTEMIYTGQTGWMQGAGFGFIFDSTLNDFISGELEHAILSCAREINPDIILIEGQSGLRNPTGPCGSEFLVSGNARHTILVHAPKRTFFHHNEAWGPIPDVASEIALIRLYGSKVIALALNTEDCSREEAFAFQAALEQQLGIPVLLPLEEGVEKIIPELRTLCAKA